MTPRQVKVNRAVRLVDPVRIATRFWNADHGAILGAGGSHVPRVVLDTPGVIASFGEGRTRVLLHWPAVRNDDGNSPSMWVDVEEVAPATAKPEPIGYSACVGAATPVILCSRCVHLPKNPNAPSTVGREMRPIYGPTDDSEALICDKCGEEIQAAPHGKGD